MRTAILAIFLCLLSLGEVSAATNIVPAVALPPTCVGVKYPPIAVRLNISASVTVGFTVLADGTAKNAYIIKSSGYEFLDQASLSCALNTRFQTAAASSETAEEYRFKWVIDKGVLPPSEADDSFHICKLNLPPATLEQVNDFTETKFFITEAGRVEGISISHSSDNGSFDQAVLSCVSGWRYSPMLQDGVSKGTNWFAIVRLDKTHTIEVTDQPTPSHRCAPLSTPVEAELSNRIALVSHDTHLIQSTGNITLDNASIACVGVLENQPAYRELIPLTALHIIWRGGVGQVVQ